MHPTMVGRLLRFWLVLAVSGVLSTADASADDRGPVRIGCAASVADVVRRCLTEMPGDPPIEMSVAASAVLTAQVLAGAPFDLVVLADETWTETLIRAEVVVPAGRRRLASNRLVMVVGAERVTAIAENEPPAGRLAVADPILTPLGRATRQAITSLGWETSLAGRVLVGDDARATLLLVETREVDAAIVYRSDAIGREDIRILREIEPGLHDPLVVEAILLRESPEARSVVETLASSECIDALISRGFHAAPSPDESWPRASGSPSDDAGVDLWTPVRTSIRVATVAVLGMLPVGVGIAWWLARSRSRWTIVVESIVALPLVLPPVVVGYLLLSLLGRRGAVGGWVHDHLGVDIAFTWWAAAIASAIMGLPLLVRSARIGIESVDRDLERAAANAGAGRWRTFRRVTLPLAAPGVIAGAALAFARCLGEFGATIVVAGNLPGKTRTLALAIWTESRTPGRESQVMLLVAVAIGLSIVATLVSEWLLRRWRPSS